MSPTQDEFAARDRWVEEHLRGARLPFSFQLGEQRSAALLPSWQSTEQRDVPAPGRQRFTRTWTSPAGLVVSCTAVTSGASPVAEWTVTVTNHGQQDSALLADLQGLDARLAPAEWTLRHWKGDDNTPDSYQPLVERLAPGRPVRLAPAGGRPSNGTFPYFNLHGEDGGVLLAVGWPGQWAASFERGGDGALTVTAGQELTHLVLRPGETVRTPLIALFFWRGSDVVRAQNLWRRWMLAENVPHPDNRPVRPLFCFCTGAFSPGLRVSEATEKLFVDALLKQQVKLDYWWMDAGWYPCRDWPETGTWEYDPARFPRGIRAVSDYVHARGMKLVLWFEPERVTGGSWLATHHPEWLLGGTLLNLGNPAARQWLTDHVDQFITSQGIDLYRQDFNMDPLSFWRANDTPDRQGVTENLHVQGYLAYWDELRRRHPGLPIDSCASGGRRNDLETLRRALPLLRSDYQSFAGDPGFALGNQGHTYGLSSWIPYYGQGVYYNADHWPYCVRSYLSPCFGFAVDVRRNDIDWNLWRKMEAEWRAAAGHMLGDFYPLTDYSLDEQRWIAWQFDQPGEGSGMVQAFRRKQCGTAQMTFRLHGLVPEATYQVKSLDTGATSEQTGRALLEQGLVVRVGEQPGADIVEYRRR